MKHKIGFIGLGLIGGSIAKAIRQYYPDYEIVAFDKNKGMLRRFPPQKKWDEAFLPPPVPHRLFVPVP